MNQNQPLDTTPPPSKNKTKTNRKSTKKASLVVLAILVMLSLGVASYFATGAIVNGDNQLSNNDKDEPSLSAKSAIDTVYERLSKMIAEQQPEETDDSIVIETVESMSPSYKVSDKSYYVAYQDGYTLTVNINSEQDELAELPLSTDSDIRQKIAEIFIELGLTKTETLGASSEDGAATDIYSGNGVVCGVNTAESQNTTTTASCGDIEKLEQVAASVAPIVAVMPEAEPDILINDIEITDSAVSGYQKAALSISGAHAQIGGYIGLFYKSPDQDWKFFQGTQGVLECSVYNTEELRNAFSGDACYDEELEESSTVEQPAAATID